MKSHDALWLTKT